MKASYSFNFQIFLRPCPIDLSFCTASESCPDLPFSWSNCDWRERITLSLQGHVLFYYIPQLFVIILVWLYVLVQFLSFQSAARSFSPHGPLRIPFFYTFHFHSHSSINAASSVFETIKSNDATSSGFAFLKSTVVKAFYKWMSLEPRHPNLRSMRSVFTQHKFLRRLVSVSKELSCEIHALVAGKVKKRLTYSAFTNNVSKVKEEALCWLVAQQMRQTRRTALFNFTVIFLLAGWCEICLETFPSNETVVLPAQMPILTFKCYSPKLALV